MLMKLHIEIIFEHRYSTLKMVSYHCVINCPSLAHPVDLIVLKTDLQTVKARKELWELISVFRTWMEEWKQLVFCEVNFSLLAHK